MEIAELTDVILSDDDYEEGEILDEDTLYDNVSSLEEFSGSENELKSQGEISSIVIKKSSEARKGKHHRRKEHKCKEDSICRKERSGKHCYARIRKGKNLTEVTTAKAKIIDPSTVQGHVSQNQKRKGHFILSPIHGTIPKYNSHHVTVQKDLPEKENRCGSHKFHRYYGCLKPQMNYAERKRLEKLKRYPTIAGRRSRSYEGRKRGRSQSPKLSRPQPQERGTLTRGTTSLLKRLVGSGSIGVKTPKDIIEEPKKAAIISLVDNNKSNDCLSARDVIVIDCEDSQDEVTENVKTGDHETNEHLLNEKAGIENHGSSVPDIFLELEDAKEVEGQEKRVVSVIREGISCNNSEETDDNNKSTTSQTVPHSVTAELVVLSLEPTQIMDIPNREDTLNNESNRDIDVSFQNDDSQKNEQEVTEDIDELHLRLEALRTAMLRKHKERKKKGFICRKKSNVEDDSFADYILSHVDNSITVVDGDENEISHNIDRTEMNILGDLLSPEDMVIDKDKGSDSECNILENFPVPQNYALQNSTSNLPVYYVGFPGNYSLYPYPELNGNLSVPFANNHLLVPSLTQDTSQIPLPVDKEPYLLKEKHSHENYLKEISTNEESLLTGRNKRVRRLSARSKLCRRRELDGKKWHSSRAVIKRKLERREFVQQKRRRKESIRDLKIIQTAAEEVSNEINEDSDEEIALRELALKSVKERDKPKNETATMETFQNLENHKVKAVNVSDNQLLNELQIEVDNSINLKPLVSFDSESTPTNLSSSETWDDIDEDILRAQLLSSLSSRIPVKQVDSTHATFMPKFTKKQAKALRRAERKAAFEIDPEQKRLKHISQKVNKENFKKIIKNKINTNIVKRKLEILRNVNNVRKKIITVKNNQQLGQQNTTSEVPIVPKFIISLNEDSSSDDEITQQSASKVNPDDVVRSIDLFLHEARIENEIKRGLLNKVKESTSKTPVETKIDEVKHPEIKIIDKKDKITDSGAGGTPQVLKHLPAWQQEEYRRLKKQIAEKERLLKAAKEKVLPPESAEELVKVPELSKDSLNTNDNNTNSPKEKKIEEIVVNPAVEIDSNESGTNIINNNLNDVKKNINSEVKQQKDEIKSKETDQQLVKTSTVLPTSPKKFQNERSKIIEEVNEMGKIVIQLEKEIGIYRNLNRDIVQKKKELLIAKLNMARKKKLLFEIRKRLISKEKLIQSKIEKDSLSNVPVKIEEENLKKQTGRAMELCKLKMREFSLTTKLMFEEIDHTNKMTKFSSKGGIESLLEKAKSSIKTVFLNNNTSTPKQQNTRILQNNIVVQPKLHANIEKLNMVNENILPVGQSSFSENWDPFVPICPFDLSGVCKDEECKFQHIKAAT